MEDHISIKLDSVIHQKSRLGIMSLLMVRGEVEFNHLKKQLKLTDGNLSTHLTILEGKNYIKIKKLFVKKRPKTLCLLTEKGRQAFMKYMNDLEKIIQNIPQRKIK
jgi:DNA-binding MarR family transcriptional regulator